MINRKIFFNTISAGFIGYIIAKSVLLNLFGFKSKKQSNKRSVKVNINPLAIRRKKIGGKNV
jgi:hypothetical protein